MENIIEKEAMFKISYGLFVLTARDGEKDNGCIVNTVSMITEKPLRITVYVNKLNYTEQMIKKTGVFNVSVLTESTPFEVFKRFGFASGRDTDKFAGATEPKKSSLHHRYSGPPETADGQIFQEGRRFRHRGHL